MQGDMAAPPPAGFKVLKACTICPPGGLVADLATLVVDYPLDGYQMFSLFKHCHFLFGSFVGFVLGFTIVLQLTCFSKPGVTPVNEFRTSLIRGQLTEPLRFVFVFERLIEAFGTALVGGYGMSLTENLSTIDASIAILSLLMSAKGVAYVWHRRDCGSKGEQATILLRMPIQAMIMKVARTSIALGFFTAFAVASRCTHPLLTLSTCALSSCAVGLWVEKKKIDALRACLPTANWFCPPPSPFGVLAGDGIGKQKSPVPAKPYLLASVFRCIAMISMCMGLSLPHGLIPWSTMGRPMGREVLISEFLAPVKMVIAWNFDGADMTAATAVFRSCLIVAAIFGTAIEMIFSTSALIFMPKYSNGKLDQELIMAGKEKDEEIIQWCDQREREALACSYSQVASSVPFSRHGDPVGEPSGE